MTKLFAPVVSSPINLHSKHLADLKAVATKAGLEPILPQSPDDRPFNGFRIARTDQARALVFDVVHQLQKYEEIFNVRQRARKPKDERTFERQVEALVCDLAYREITKAGAWLTVSLSHTKLGLADRYRAAVLGRTLPAVVELMTMPEMDFVERVVGYRNFSDPKANRQTVIRATERLRTRIDDYKLTLADFAVDKTEEIIILKDSKEGHWDKGQWLQYEDTAETMAYRDELSSINAWLEQADIDYEPWDAREKPVDHTDRRLLRYFNNGSFEQGGRLFGGFWQYLRKDQRSYGILIDGSPVVTLDYGQMVPRILYGLSGVDPHFDDAYAVPGLEDYRDGVKKVFNAMLHIDHWHSRKPAGTADLLPKDMTIAEIIDLILDFHKPVADAFFAGKGLYLTYQESRILLAVLGGLVEQGITALPIHDAVIVAEGHAEQTKQIMLEVFKDLTGTDGLVRLEE
jgi:hypothetical protein